MKARTNREGWRVGKGNLRCITRRSGQVLLSYSSPVSPQNRQHNLYVFPLRQHNGKTRKNESRVALALL